DDVVVRLDDRPMLELAGLPDVVAVVARQRRSLGRRRPRAGGWIGLRRERAREGRLVALDLHLARLQAVLEDGRIESCLPEVVLEPRLLEHLLEQLFRRGPALVLPAGLD